MKKLSLLIYLLLPLIYFLKGVVFLLDLLGFIEECNCENMEQEKFYFQEKILISSIGMILIILYIASL